MIHATRRLATLPPGPPLLQVVVDTEEEFDWHAPFDRTQVAVTAIGAQHLAQALYAPYGLVPTYVVDYPVATTPEAAGALQQFHTAGQCLIGTHLHPWVNPPHDELVSTFNSYAGNLDPALERAKLTVLTDAIATSFGVRPTMYKAGRYGLGPATSAALQALGYTIDLSVVPHTAYTDDGGPDFREFPDRAYWADGSILEIPLATGFHGALARSGAGLYERLQSANGQRLRLPGIASRLGLLERTTLTPEGVDFPTQKRLIEAMLRQGHRLFTMTYHSPSLAAGHTPYVRSAADLSAFLDRIRRLLAYFFGTLGGAATTPLEIRRLALAGPDHAVQDAAADALATASGR